MTTIKKGRKQVTKKRTENKKAERNTEIDQHITTLLQKDPEQPRIRVLIIVIVAVSLNSPHVFKPEFRVC